MTKFSEFIRALGTAGPPTREGIRALGFAFETDIPAALTEYLWLGGAQTFTSGEKLQGRANLGVVIGTDVQAFSTSLTSLAGLTTAADRLAYTTGADTWAVTTLTAFARTLLDDANAAAARTTIGLGNVDNTSDLNKPISTATQTALNLKANLTAQVKSAKAQLTDTKAQGTASQALANATWNIRQINTENSDVDGIVTISSNTFTLLAGSDYSVRAFVAALAENTSNQRNVIRFWNVTDSVAVQVTQTLVSTTNTIVAGLSIEAILTGGKTYRVEHYTSGSVAGGIGANNLAGMSEVYLSIMIERLTNGFV